MLKIIKLNKSFDNFQVINNCNVSIEKNKITALIGSNGCGKTTILKLISGIIKPDSGKILFSGRNVNYLPIHKISQLGISSLPQKTMIFENLTLNDNLMLSLKENDTKILNSLVTFKDSDKHRKKIINYLELFNLSRRSKSFGYEFSYGQKRIVNFLQIILRKHSLLILDEPLAGINPENKKIMSEIILKLKKRGSTILIVEHNKEWVLDLADKLIFMENGKIIKERSLIK
jgi:branched-chain amino acid transport system ATP-binding protein